MALGPRTKKPLPTEAAEYVAEPPPGIRIGIALSGGGIRSAAFNLGAIQAMQKHHLLESAQYLTAVSGGNYVASALMISAAYSDSDCENGIPQWAHGSPEERYLRQHTDYLAPGRAGRVWLVLSVVCGFILNYLPFLLCAFIAGRLAGWLLCQFGLTLDDLRFNALTEPPSIERLIVLGIAGALLLIALALVAYRRLTDGRRRVGDYGETHSEFIAPYLIMGAGLIGVCLVLPALAVLYRTVSGFVLSEVVGVGEGTFDDSMYGRVGIAVGWLVGSLVLAVAALVLSRRTRARGLLLVLSATAGAGLVLVPLLSSLEYSTRQGVRSRADVLGLVAAVVLVLLMAVMVPNRRYSMHLFYRERLNSVFALKRCRNQNGKIIAEPLGYGQQLKFSEIGQKLDGDGTSSGTGRLPKLIVCCAVNATTDEVPVGRFAESFTFEHDQCGGPRFGFQDTTYFEQPSGVPGTQLTLPSIMALSGAALSPMMGRFTYPPLRFLMALTNVRLGVWVKNPHHRSWNVEASPAQRSNGSLARAARWIWDGWREPGAFYVLREALGVLRFTHRYIYLTDGGHWENLGLVELVRRRCTHVLCFDATSDQAGAGLDIGRAIALARSELGADIELDPRPVLPAADGSSNEMVVEGVIRCPDQQEAKLVYAKAVLTAEASWDLFAFKARDARFPNHSTGQQVFTDEQFEAYRSLGYEAGCRAARLLNIPESLLAPARSVNVDNGQVDAGIPVPTR